MQHSTFQLFILICFIGVSSCIDCKNKPNGFYEVSCLTMVKCTDGKFQKIMCPKGEVIDTTIHECRPVQKVKPPCGKLVDCSKLKDGSYPDLDQQCKTYYTCLGGHFLGHNFCPDRLIFNDEIKICDFKANVAKPCGDQ